MCCVHLGTRDAQEDLAFRKALPVFILLPQVPVHAETGSKPLQTGVKRRVVKLNLI